MRIRKGLALVLALVLTLSLLPAPTLAANETTINIKDTSKSYPAYTQQFGRVKALEDKSDSTQVFDYTVPNGGVTVLLFFRASGVCMNSNNIMDELGQTSWAKNEKVNIVAVEVDRADKSTTQSYIDSHDTAGVIDHVYYGNSTPASWYAKLVQNNGDMTGVTNLGGASLSFGYALVITQGDDGNYIRYSLPNLASAEELTSFVGEFVDISGDVGDIEDYTSLYTTTIRDPKWDYGPAAEELTLLNEYRVSKGLGELDFDATMQRAAMQRAAQIAVYYSHTLPDHTQSTQYAENIGAGYATAAAAMEGWLNSEGHRQNIETAAFKSVGLGCFTASDGTMYWVQLFSSEAPAEESIEIAGGYESEVIVARKYLELSTVPASVTLEVGKAETVTLKNTNQGFPYGVSKIYATSWSSQDPTIVKAERGDGGTVTITAVGAGKTTVQVGLEPAVLGIKPLVVDIPVTVTAPAEPSPSASPSTEPSPEPSQQPKLTTLTAAMLTVDTTAETYTGSPITKTVTGKDGTKTLTQNTDYTVAYHNNTNVGTATLTITGMGNYTGTLTYTFTIRAKITKTVEITKYDYDQARMTNYDFDGWTPVGTDEHGLIYTQKGDKYGLFDSICNKEILPCKYDWIDDFDDDGLALVRLGDWETGKCGYIDKTGKEVIPLQYDYASDFSSYGLAAVEKNGKWGYIDRTGKEIIACQYDTASYFRDGWGIVGMSTGEKDRYGDTIYQYGVVDANGNEVVPCQYRYMRYTAGYVTESTESAITICVAGDGPRDIDNAKWAILDPATGKTVSYDYDVTIDHVGGIAYPQLYFSEGLAQVSLNGKSGFIDKTGKEVVPCKYDGAYTFSEGLAAVLIGDWGSGKWGYIDQTDKTVIPFQYARAANFSEGLSQVKLDPDGKIGYIDKTGALVIPCQYDYADPFSGGLACVTRDGEAFYIDQTGRHVPESDYMELGDNLKLVRRNGKVGLTNAAGKDLIPCQYDAVYSWNDGTALVELDGKIMFVDEMGTELKTNMSIPTPYDFDEGWSDSENAHHFKENWNWVGGFIYDHREWTSDSSYRPREGVCTFTVKTSTDTGDKPSGGGGSSSSGGSGSSRPSGGGGGSNTISQPTQTGKPTSEQFTDVVKDSWYEAGVSFVVEKGLFQGVAPNQFAPNTNMTRAMLMTVLARLDGQDTAGGETWYAKGMDWAKAQGISDGTLPDNSVTREQLVTMLYRYARVRNTRGDLTSFADGASVSDWAREAMTWAVANGILTGKDGKRLDPQGTATRAEVATILQRFVANK